MGSRSSGIMKGGNLLIVTVLGLLALSEGGHLFGKGLVKGAFKSLFKSEKKEQQHCEIKWEDVWKPHCTTTYEKVKRFHRSIFLKCSFTFVPRKLYHLISESF